MMETGKTQPPWYYYPTDWEVQFLGYNVSTVDTRIKAKTEHVVGYDEKRNIHIDYYLCYLEFDGQKLFETEMFAKNEEEAKETLSILMVDFYIKSKEEFARLMGKK